MSDDDDVVSGSLAGARERAQRAECALASAEARIVALETAGGALDQALDDAMLWVDKSPGSRQDFTAILRAGVAARGAWAVGKEGEGDVLSDSRKPSAITRGMTSSIPACATIRGS